MANKCSVCGRGPRAGKTVSHSNRATNRFFHPNIVKKRIHEGSSKRVRICTSCLKRTNK
ncbi:50S ribosomal protein L28 [Elusimicrobiota bacterium]